jgi:superfamily I DNA and RNA helicase
LALSVLAQKFDAIVVDEAQDFSDEYWFAIEELLSDPEDGALYVFTDPNQALYKRHSNLPVRDEPFHLTTNCRNTAYIHHAAYRYFQGEPTDPPDIEGAELIRITGRSIEDQAAHIAREVSRLIAHEGVRPSQIVILVLGRPKSQFYDALAKHSLGNATGWSIEVHDPGRVLMETVKRFKGLEATIVFLWLSPVPSETDDREALYVGLSRAKSMIYIVGTENACAALL